jgi:hypothetical protein
MKLPIFKKIAPKTSLILVGLITAAVQVIGTPTAFAQACSTTTTPATTYGQVKQSITVASAGTYRVWSRIKAPDTTNNSYYLQIDNGCAYNVGDSSSIAANQWMWINYKDGVSTSYIDVALSAGTHNVIYTGKEANVQLDRVLFLSDTGCTPSGTGDNCANATTGTTNLSVTMTSPANNSSVSVGTAVTLSANVTDNLGITKVEFYDGTTLLNSDTASPYSYSWATTSATGGPHTLTAKAYDTGGNIVSSNGVIVTLTSTAGGSSTGPVVGDTGGDGHVNSLDYSIVITHFNQNYPAADFNHDGVVNAPDLAILLSHWTW